MRDEFRQPFALLPRRSNPRIWVAKPSEGSVQEFVRGRSVSAGALSVKGPAKNQLCRTILFSSHSSEPMVDQCGLPDTGPGNDGNDVDFLVGPCTMQKSYILLPAKNFASCNGQSGY